MLAGKFSPALLGRLS